MNPNVNTLLRRSISVGTMVLLASACSDRGARSETPINDKGLGVAAATEKDWTNWPPFVDPSIRSELLRQYNRAPARLVRAWISGDAAAILAHVELGAGDGLSTRLDVWTVDSLGIPRLSLRSESAVGDTDLELHYFGRAQNGNLFVAVLSAWDESETGSLLLLRQAEPGQLAITHAEDLVPDFGVLSLARMAVVTTYASKLCSVGTKADGAQARRWIVDTPAGFRASATAFDCASIGGD